MLHTISKINRPNIIDFDQLEQFLNVEPNLFQIILELITEKNEKENTGLQVEIDCFSKHFDKLSDNIELIKKAYVQQYLMHSHFDCTGNAFLQILKIDRDFLIEFIESVYSESNRYRFGKNFGNMSYVWNIENIEGTLSQVLDFMIGNYSYLGILEHDCDIFFRNSKEEEKERIQKFLKQYMIENNNDCEKMNAIISIITTFKKRNI